MEIKFDIPKLKTVLCDLYDLTNITISLFDRDFNFLVDSITDENFQPFCSKLRSDSETLYNLCEECNRSHLELASKLREPLFYTCHAGVCESITPVYIEDVLVAYIMLGKYRDYEEIYSSTQKMRDAAKKYDLDEASLTDLYKTLPVIKSKSIGSIIRTLKICIYYITNENLIRFLKNTITLRIEEYIETNLARPLTEKTLCKHFDLSLQELRTIFSRDFGCTLHDYLYKRRRQKAEKLLLETDLSIATVMQAVGYTESGYFANFIKKEFGKTPLQFRKSHKT